MSLKKLIATADVLLLQVELVCVTGENQTDLDHFFS